MPSPALLGLVGGIGAGKSHVSKLFAELGAHVIAADAFGHEALRQPEIKAQAVEYWGEGILDAEGHIDRRTLGRIVFADEAERKTLERLVFPWIENRIRSELGTAQAHPAVPLLVLDAAIMMESGWSGICDAIVFVDAPAEVRWERVARDRHWTREEWERREASQLDLAAKRRAAHHVVVNAGDEVETRRQVAELFDRYAQPRERLSP
jgi:dephospho-CoA kinase